MLFPMTGDSFSTIMATYSYSQHLTLRPFLANMGGSLSHLSKRKGQRAANRQPVGRLIRLGGWPLMNIGSELLRRRGTLAISICAYGWSGAGQKSRAWPVSTI